MTLCVLSCSQYLENYLWINYSPAVSSNSYLMSICCMVNEKFRENVPAWEVRAEVWRVLKSTSARLLCSECSECNVKSSFFSVQVFKKEPKHFPHFFKCVMEACLTGEELGLQLREQTVLLLFLDHCFNSLVSLRAFLMFTRLICSSHITGLSPAHLIPVTNYLIIIQIIAFMLMKQ